jgi:hypothetical protein
MNRNTARLNSQNAIPVPKLLEAGDELVVVVG